MSDAEPVYARKWNNEVRIPEPSFVLNVPNEPKLQAVAVAA